MIPELEDLYYSILWAKVVLFSVKVLMTDMCMRMQMLDILQTHSLPHSACKFLYLLSGVKLSATELLDVFSLHRDHFQRTLNFFKPRFRVGVWDPD